jgi:CspA family cold shock protein
VTPLIFIKAFITGRLKENHILYSGRVERYSEDKGFGYITRDDGTVVLVERDAINMEGFKTLTPGDQVSFDVESTLRGLAAKNVKKLPN